MILIFPNALHYNPKPLAVWECMWFCTSARIFHARCLPHSWASAWGSMGWLPPKCWAFLHSQRKATGGSRRKWIPPISGTFRRDRDRCFISLSYKNDKKRRTEFLWRIIVKFLYFLASCQSFSAHFYDIFLLPLQYKATNTLLSVNWDSHSYVILRAVVGKKKQPCFRLCESYLNKWGVLETSSQHNWNLNTGLETIFRVKKKKKRKEKIKLKLKCFERKAKFALQIAPEGNNEEKSCTGEKKKTLCSKSWNLALSNTHQRAESQKKANVSQHPHAGGGVSVIIQLLSQVLRKDGFPSHWADDSWRPFVCAI